MKNNRNRHPDKEIEAAIKYAEKHGWRFKGAGSSSHAWGKLYCPNKSREGHKISIWSTPRNSTVHAVQIKRAVNRCSHQEVR